MSRSYLCVLVVLVAMLSVQHGNVRAQITTTFNYTGGVQYWTVPPCVTFIQIVARGGKGGNEEYSRGGYGARLSCEMAVTPGDVFAIYVGGKGDSANCAGALAGGFNGGGAGSCDVGAGYAGAGGGGATDIRMYPYDLASRVLVAAGGGGAGRYCLDTNAGRGGDASGLTGERGYDCGMSTGSEGQGGTPTIGGTGGLWGSYGGDGLADSGGYGAGAGGGGGSGWYGGGGGSWAGGGAGSSYVGPMIGTFPPPGYSADTTDTGNGSVTITIPCVYSGLIDRSSGTAYPFEVCEGASMMLENILSTPCGTWISTDTLVATVGSTGLVTGVAAGTATISFYNPNNCGDTATRIITVDPLPAPITGPDNVCVNGTITLSDTSGLLGWVSSDPYIATVDIFSGVVTGISTGIVNIDYILVTRCMTSKTITVETCPVSVDEIAAGDRYKVVVSPNPVDKELTIVINDRVYNTFTVTNSIGQVLIERQLRAGETTVSVKDLPPGMFYITFKGENNICVQRFVKLE